MKIQTAIVIIALLLAVPVVAQESASYKVKQHSINQAGHPEDGVSPASSGYGLEYATLGEVSEALPMSSPSYYLLPGFRGVLPPAACNDADGDGYGTPGRPDCPAGPETDCDNTKPEVYPGAMELCDTFDNDCDAEVDEPTLGVMPDGTLWAITCQRFNDEPEAPEGTRPDRVRPARDSRPADRRR